MEESKHRRLSASENSLEARAAIEGSMKNILVGIRTLHERSADVAQKLSAEAKILSEQLTAARQELAALSSQLEDKRERELNEVTLIYQEQYNDTMENLIKENISIPEVKLRLYWDQLKCRVDPAPGGSGVIVILGFPHSCRLNDLRFLLQFDGSFSVPECDPMVMGLKSIVDSLNADNRSGALARFCCRMRSTYNTQYETN